ncbi:MAG: hypothetical protein Q9202_006740 [Teloschistes flavicans]
MAVLAVRFGTGRHFIAAGVIKLQANVKVSNPQPAVDPKILVSPTSSTDPIRIRILLVNCIRLHQALHPALLPPSLPDAEHIKDMAVVLGIVSTFGAAFQCTPVKFLWDFTVPGGHCINFSAFARFTGVMNVVTDVLILSLPIPIVWSLHLERSKKIGVCALFLLGGFVCVTSIVRLYYLEAVDSGHGVDPTWENVNAAIWSCVEPCIGIVCACLPVMGPLLRTHIVSLATSAFRSRSKRSKQSGSSGYTGEGSSRSRKGFGSLGEGKVGRERGVQDEEMGIPLKDQTEVGGRDGSQVS